MNMIMVPQLRSFNSWHWFFVFTCVCLHSDLCWWSLKFVHFILFVDL